MNTANNTANQVGSTIEQGKQHAGEAANLATTVADNTKKAANEAINQGLKAAEQAIDAQAQHLEKAIDATIKVASDKVDKKVHETNTYVEEKRQDLEKVICLICLNQSYSTINTISCLVDHS